MDNIRKEMAQDFRADSCIAASRIVVEVLDAMGIKADGLRVRLIVYNPFLANEMDRRGVPASVVLEDNPDEAWSVGLGLPENVHQPDSGLHVVAWADSIPGTSRALLVDLSLDQASRPHKAMPLGPLVTEVPRGYADEFRRSDGGIVLSRPDGVVIAYTRHPNDSGYWRASGNWAERDAVIRREIVQRAIDRTPVARADRRRWARQQRRMA